MPIDATILLALILATPVAAGLILLSWAFQKIARRAGRIPPDKFSWVERPWAVRPAAAFLGIYVACFLYGLLVEAHWVEVTEIRIAVDRPILDRDRVRLVHLSDLHLEEELGGRERRALEEVRKAKPDLILLTGDYMNTRRARGALSEFVKELVSVARVYGVEGNWDSKFEVARIFREAGARLLNDETELIDGPGRGLRLVGMGIHPKASLGELLRDRNDGAYTVYLRHKPEGVDDLLPSLRTRGPAVDLFLCGHTHGGQVCLPFWGAVVTMSKHHKTYERGLYDVGGTAMVVNRGLGMEGGPAPRVRFLSRPEVTVIDLVVSTNPKSESRNSK